MLNKLYREFKYWLRWITIKFLRLIDPSDYNRWSKSHSLSPDWDDRTILISSYIKPDSSVFEFGAGRMILKENLPTGCKYTPSDIVDRGNGTIICDLNEGLPFIEKHNYIVFSGVLEYVKDISSLIHQLKDCADIIICSYATQSLNSTNRTIFGWINNHTNQEFISIFNNNDFELAECSAWNSQTIYVFQKRGDKISID
ncbi:MAG TPA: hypothetical protein PKL31_03360 [Fulvivirga sp.]|nr:hypothetical protein [Fulvivirga sp.]